MPLTLQETPVFVVLVTVAENESVSPSNTLPDVGLTVTVMGGGGGGFELPPPPPPQAPRRTLRARTKSARAMRRADRTRDALVLCFVRVCGGGRMLFATADRGPARAQRGAAAGGVLGKNLCVF